MKNLILKFKLTLSKSSRLRNFSENGQHPKALVQLLPLQPHRRGLTKQDQLWLSARLARLSTAL